MTARSAMTHLAVSLGLGAAIGWWAMRGISPADLRAGFAGVPPVVAITTLGLFTGSFFTVEVIGFGLSWRRHLVPDVPWRDVRALVCGKRVLGTVLPVLTKLVAPLYFWRRWRVRASHAVSASELVGTAELITVLLFTSATPLAPGGSLGAGLTAVVAVGWLALLVGFAWLRSPRLRRWLLKLRGAGLLHAFARATPAELALQLTLRGAHQGLTLACLWGLLAGMGARLSASQLLAFGPLFLFSGTLPISLAGYGGPQALAVALLAHRWNLMPPGRAMAFSLAWSTGLLVLQTGVGMAWLPRMTYLLGARPPDPAAGRAGNG